MEHKQENTQQSLWSETKRPDPAEQIAPDGLRFVDPLDKIEVHSETEERIQKLSLAAAAIGICSVVTFPLKIIPIILGAIALLLGIRMSTQPGASYNKPAKIAIVTGIIGIAAAILNLTLFPALMKLFAGVAGGMVPEDLS